MALSQEHIERIERYLRNELSDEERKRFEEELQSNQELASALELEKHIYGGVRTRAREEIKTKVSQVHQELKTDGFFNTKTKTMSRSSQRRLLTIAAAAAIVLVAYVFFMKQEKSPMDIDNIVSTYKEFDRQNLQDHVAKLSQVGFADPQAGQKDSLRQAIELIDGGKYTEARSFLVVYSKAYPDDFEGMYYAGLNQLQLGNYAEAIKVLNSARVGLEGENKDDAEYYYALSLLALEDNNETARGEFQKIASDTKSEYQDLAKDILAQLD